MTLALTARKQRLVADARCHRDAYRHGDDDQQYNGAAIVPDRCGGNARGSGECGVFRCVAGEIASDTGFIYICTAANTWKRVAIATW